jgi:hypothetical protein
MSGTLISELGDEVGNGNDNDLVQKILADVSGSTERMTAPPPPMPNHLPAHANPGYNAGMNMPPPSPGAAGMIAMDSHVPTAHMIGSEHPTPGDFARAMAGLVVPPQGANAYPSPQGAPYLSTQHRSDDVKEYEPPKKNIYSRLIDEAKVPFVVALLFFLFSLPPIRILFAHYLPQLVKPTGEFQLLGLLTVSLVVGITFWILQRVIVPLLSL